MSPFVVMPNHVHDIGVIYKPPRRGGSRTAPAQATVIETDAEEANGDMAPEPHLVDIPVVSPGARKKEKRPLRTAFSLPPVAEGVECVLIRKPQTCRS